MTYTIEQLEEVGGNLWERGEMRRVYFNDLPKWFGLHTTHYKTGNVSYAELDGEKISNTSATELLYKLNNAKVWYDLTSGEFRYKGLDPEMAKKIVKNIIEEIPEEV